MTGPIKSWSFSKISDFERCPGYVRLKYIERIPEPERELPAGKTEHANDRGSRMHDAAEHFVDGSGPFLRELGAFQLEFAHLRDLYSDGRVSLEGEWGMDEHWEIAPWKTAWHRSKLDAMVHADETKAVVIDYKGLPLSTPLPTPIGWTTMGEVQPGDTLFAADGSQCKVLGKSQVKHLHNYRISFDDTSIVECDEDHRWVLLDGAVQAVTALNIGDRIATAKPIDLPPAELLIDPYVLGIWLADGKHTSGEITKPDQFIWEEIVRRGYILGNDYNAFNDKCTARTVLKLRGQLGKLGLLGDKQIPQNYLRASYQQRLDLLRGIFDGDGSANHTRKQAVMNTVRRDFADQVAELLLSLGQRPLVSPYIARGFGKTLEAFAVSFRPNGLNPFSLPRKANKVLASWGPGRAGYRQITAIKVVESQPTQCIAVDSADHTFLCTSKFLPTHNSGKKWGNELKHGQQLQLYTVNAFLRFPYLESVTTELWYLDQDDITSMTFTRNQGLRFKLGFEQRGNALVNATDFPFKPSTFACRWCAYGDPGGACKVSAKHAYPGKRK